MYINCSDRPDLPFSVFSATSGVRFSGTAPFPDDIPIAAQWYCYGCNGRLAVEYDGIHLMKTGGINTGRLPNFRDSGSV